MSPEHASIMGVNRVLRRQFEEAAGKNAAQLFNEGGFFDAAGGEVRHKPLSEVTGQEIAAARKEGSKKHLVYGAETPRAAERQTLARFDGSSDNDSICAQGVGGHPKKYRGNHRSQTKGAWFRAFFRSWRPPGYRR